MAVAHAPHEWRQVSMVVDTSGASLVDVTSAVRQEQPVQLPGLPHPQWRPVGVPLILA